MTKETFTQHTLVNTAVTRQPITEVALPGIHVCWPVTGMTYTESRTAYGMTGYWRNKRCHVTKNNA